MTENKTAKTPADGPVAWACQCGRAYTVTCISSKPAKQWVGLTHPQIHELDWPDGVSFEDILLFVRSIEQALKEKNT